MDKMTVIIKTEAGEFAENKDKARELRINKIEPALKEGKKVVLDFDGVSNVTQSFIHALVSQIIRDNGPDILDYIDFKHCNEKVQGIIEIVVDYMQQVD